MPTGFTTITAVKIDKAVTQKKAPAIAKAA